MPTHRFTKDIDKTVQVELDWENELLVKSLPMRAFTNNLTSRLMISCQAILANSFKQLRRINRFYGLTNADDVERYSV